MLDKHVLRQVMGQFATGITVVTTHLNGKNYGFTANSFTSASLEPPLVLFCLNKTSEGCQEFIESGCFAINILAHNQTEISNRFANSKLEPHQRFEGLAIEQAKTGSPILQNTMGWFDCQLKTHYDGGDHWIFIGEVVDLFRSEENEPLIYFGGKYRSLAE